MKLTTKGHYAVTAMLDIALNDPDQPIKVETLAARHGLSVSYLEQLTGRMRASGLLKSVRGPGGGYQLARKPNEISVADIILSVEEKMDATRCQGKSDCHQGATCITHHLWDELNQQIMNFLNSMTLSRLVGLHKKPKILSAKLEMIGSNP